MPRLQNPIRPNFKKPNMKAMNLKTKMPGNLQLNKNVEKPQKTGSSKSVLIVLSIVIVLGGVCGFVFATLGNGTDTQTNSPTAELINPTVKTENAVSNNIVTPIVKKTEIVEMDTVKPAENNIEKPIIEEPVNEKPKFIKPEVIEKANDVKCLNPNKDFAQNFFEKVSLISPKLPETMKREMLNTWSMKVAKIALAWQRFSNECKNSQRWGISRKSAELADDWNYLADFFSKDVKPEDRTFLRTLVADLVEREVTLENQCK